MLVVTTPAAAAELIGIQQMRLAAGLASDDTSKDVELQDLAIRISNDICTACRVSVGAGAPPTLRRETLTETFFCSTAGKILLSRRHDVVITSITVDDVALLPVEYLLEDAEAGILIRIGADGYPVYWRGRKTVVVYQAGFSTVPGDLAGAAMDLARVRTSETTRDPMLKSERVFIHDVQEVQRDYWVGMGGVSKSTTSVPQEIHARLGRYINPGNI